MSARVALARIIQFGLIKVAPGVFNLALIPYLLVAMGAETYGRYSIWLGYAMLVANTIAAIISQPMYRYLSSRPEDRNAFASSAVFAAALAGIAGLGVSVTVGAPWLLSLGFAAHAMGAVLGTAANVDFTVARQVGRMALYEGLRILAILLVLATPVLRGSELRLGHVVFGMAVSNILPLAVTVRRLHFAWPGPDWLLQTWGYGIRSAIWLLLAGLPVVGAKTILIDEMPGEAFGTYTAIADLTYRGFAISNSALMMWAFPLLSQQYDCGNLAEVRRTLRFTLLVYAAGGAMMLAGMLGALPFLPIPMETLPGGPIAAAVITAASFSWHGMSIAHKPLEMTFRTTRMAALMALAAGTFYALTFGLIQLAGLDAFYVAMLAMIVVAVAYALITANQSLEA